MRGRRRDVGSHRHGEQCILFRGDATDLHEHGFDGTGSGRTGSRITLNGRASALQDCQVHHILPRPDGKRWDGMFYWGPGLKKGILFIFRPQSDATSQTVKLKGLDPAKLYKVWSEEGSIAAVDWSGRHLMDTGLEIKLPTINSSDLIFIEEQ